MSFVMSTFLAKIKLQWGEKSLALIALLLVYAASSATQSLYAQASNWKAPAYADTLTNPLEANSPVIAEGKALFNAICYVCHGKSGKGDGMNAASLSKKPADLTSQAVQQQSDGALFWKITEGNPPMLSFKQTLSKEKRWKVIHYVRTLAANREEASQKTATTDKKKEEKAEAGERSDKKVASAKAQPKSGNEDKAVASNEDSDKVEKEPAKSEEQSKDEVKITSAAPTSSGNSGGSGGAASASPSASSSGPAIGNTLYWILSGVLIFVLVVLYSLKNVIDALATAYNKQSSKISTKS
mgnify:CR=1 FL=1